MSPSPPSSYLCPHSLETAKSTAQAATMAAPVDLSMAFTQPASPAASPTPTLAAVGTLTPAHMLSTHYGAMPLSGLLGVKSVPFLTLSSPGPAVAVTAAPSHTTLAAYTAKISSANCIKKPERQKFAPYWCSVRALGLESQMKDSCSVRPQTPDVAISAGRETLLTFILWRTNREETNGDEDKAIKTYLRF